MNHASKPLILFEDQTGGMYGRAFLSFRQRSKARNAKVSIADDRSLVDPARLNCIGRISERINSAGSSYSWRSSVVPAVSWIATWRTCSKMKTFSLNNNGFASDDFVHKHNCLGHGHALSSGPFRIQVSIGRHKVQNLLMLLLGVDLGQKHDGCRTRRMHMHLSSKGGFCGR
jgi:hypothetical protein